MWPSAASYNMATTCNGHQDQNGLLIRVERYVQMTWDHTMLCQSEIHKDAIVSNDGRKRRTWNREKNDV